MAFMNNPRVAQCALEKSGASFKKGRVEAINLKPNGGFVLRSDCLIKCHFSQRWCSKVVFRHSEMNTEIGEDVLRKEGGFGSEGGLLGSCADCPEAEFDVVVVAAPQTRDKTKIAGAESNIQRIRKNACKRSNSNSRWRRRKNIYRWVLYKSRPLL